MSKSRPLITESQVLEAAQQGQRTIHVDGRPIITPLAESSLAQYGIQVISAHGDGSGNAGTPARAPNATGVKGYDLNFLLGLYRTMQRIRAFETAVGVLFRKERILGFAHLSIGQEAVPAGTCAALRPDDYLTLTHRGHGQMVGRGARMDKMMAELYGKATGYCKGKGGSVHLADFTLGILGANGIVGAGIVIATGAAMSAKMRGTKQVAIAFFGDGAVNQGAFHESLNYASDAKLPVIFVCENNQYAVSMSERKATAATSIAERGRAYLMPGVQVDGQDVLAVFEATQQAVDRARRGEGPSMIECLTYRYHGHWEGETVDLRPPEEVKQWEARDPIRRLAQALLAAKMAPEQQLRAIAEEVRNETVEAIKFAESSPFPPVGEALRDVLSPQFPVEEAR